MLREVGEQDRQVEPDGLGGVVVGLHELDVVDLPLVVSLRVATHQEEDLLAGVFLGFLQLNLEIFREDGTVVVTVGFFKGGRVAQVFKFEEHVAVLQYHLIASRKYLSSVVSRVILFWFLCSEIRKVPDICKILSSLKLPWPLNLL